MDYSTIVISAAGYGKRMKKFGPKANILLCDGETVLQRQVRIFNDVFGGKCNIVVVVGYLDDKVMDSIEDENVLFVKNHDYKNNNVGYSLSKGMSLIRSSRYILCCGDIVFDHTSIKNIVGVDRSSVITEFNTKRKSEVGCIVNQNNEITNMCYKVPCVWSQIAVLLENESSIFKSIGKNPEFDKLFAFEYLNKIIESGGYLENRRIHKPVVEIDVLSDIELANEFVRENP